MSWNFAKESRVFTCKVERACFELNNNGKHPLVMIIHTIRLKPSSPLPEPLIYFFQEDAEPTLMLL
jgi:hypothetical protein